MITEFIQLTNHSAVQQFCKQKCSENFQIFTASVMNHTREQLNISIKLKYTQKKLNPKTQYWMWFKSVQKLVKNKSCLLNYDWIHITLMQKQ